MLELQLTLRSLLSADGSPRQRNRTISSRRQEQRRRFKLGRQNITQTSVVERINSTSRLDNLDAYPSIAGGIGQVGNGFTNGGGGDSQASYSFNRTVTYQNRTWGSSQKPVHWVDRYWHWSSSSNASTRAYDADLDGTTLAPSPDDEIYIAPQGIYSIPEIDDRHPWSFHGSLGNKSLRAIPIGLSLVSLYS